MNTVDDISILGRLLRATLLIKCFRRKQEGRALRAIFAPNCLYDSGVDTRFSCPMVKRGRVSNNYEFEVKYNCSGLIKFPLIQELCFTQCFPRFAPIGHFSRRELIGAQRAALVFPTETLGTNWQQWGLGIRA